MGVCDQNTALTGPAHRLAVASLSAWSLGTIRDAQAGGVRPPTTPRLVGCNLSRNRINVTTWLH